MVEDNDLLVYVGSQGSTSLAGIADHYGIQPEDDAYKSLQTQLKRLKRNKLLATEGQRWKLTPEANATDNKTMVYDDDESA